MTAVHSGWLSDPKSNGAAILITDVTQVRNAEQMRSEFVANASHELKTPITSISGFAELLSAGVVTDPEKQKEYLARIQNETQRMASLIDDILKLSHLESGESGNIEPEEIQLKYLTEDILEDLRPQMEAIGVTAKPVSYTHLDAGQSFYKIEGLGQSNRWGSAGHPFLHNAVVRTEYEDCPLFKAVFYLPGNPGQTGGKFF